MRIIGAFDEVRSSLNVLINDWVKITELRSVYRRLKEFQNSINIC